MNTSTVFWRLSICVWATIVTMAICSLYNTMSSTMTIVGHEIERNEALSERLQKQQAMIEDQNECIKMLHGLRKIDIERKKADDHIEKLSRERDR